MAEKDFFQEGPRLGNQFVEDQHLVSYLKWTLPAELQQEVFQDLKGFGERVVTDILEMAKDAEAQEPVHIPFDAWGRRIDEIKLAKGWQDLEAVSAEEGLVAIAYERRQGEYSRLYQCAKLYLFGPSSAIYNCPLAMSDGAARLLESMGPQDLVDRAYQNLVSRKPSQFWTSGQWMTEKTGGSDVRQSRTIAEPQGGDIYRLYGTKWFTSATTSPMTMTLAYIKGQEERGLSLFYLETRDSAGALNHITIHRLKDKLGTRALPTAELSLQGSYARLIGEPGKGVKSIAILFNITRIHNAIAATGMMRRAFALALDYSQKRVAFGRTLVENPLHRNTLFELALEVRGALHLSLDLAKLQGQLECQTASSEAAAVVRLLTPLAKLYTAKQAVKVCSEVLESFGGAGYIENTEIPKWLRDAQVLPIWEGTTNVLSLDVLRALQKEDCLEPFLAYMQKRLKGVREDALQKAVKLWHSNLLTITKRFQEQAEQDQLFVNARCLAFSLARLFIGASMLEYAQWCASSGEDKKAVYAACRWVEEKSLPLMEAVSQRDDQLNREFFSLG